MGSMWCANWNEGVTPSDIVLSALREGAKSYEQLVGLVQNLDFTLGPMLKSKQIVLLYGSDGPARFAIPPAQDKEPTIGRKILHCRIPVKHPRVPRPRCKQCGEPCNRRDVKFCSRQCLVAFMTLPRANCLICGRPVNEPKAKFCSRECADRRKQGRQT